VLILQTVCLAILLFPFSGAAALAPEKASFVAEMVRKHGFDAADLAALLAQAEERQAIIDAISRPAEAKPWYQYRRIFVTPARARGGAEFWRENAQLLAAVEESSGVPAEIIVAIIGVETSYGRHSGGFRVLDALNTLAFGYPKREAFFRAELEQFLLLAREEGFDPLVPKGSYAGAMGMPQFIPSSYRRYAVDYDRDGHRDLWHSNADAIGSVANYFVSHGWRRGEPIVSRGFGLSQDHQELLLAGMEPSIELTRLLEGGVSAKEALPADTLVSLVRLDNGTEDEYWLGLHNFYVITRYNHSTLYAMAVYQLSREILRLRAAG